MELTEIKKRYEMCLKIQSIVSDADDTSYRAKLLRSSVDMDLIYEFIVWCEDYGINHEKN